jgi:hypothetical protein
MKIYRHDINKRSLIRWKVYIDRSRMYIGYIQFFLIGTMFIQPFRDKLWAKFVFDNPLISIPVAVVLFIALSLFLGYLDSKLGFREEEMRNLSKSNPVMMEMLTEIRELRKKLEEKEANKE